MITVLIPTANRPDFLGNALKSVAQQSALDQIAEVVVSESAGDRRSDEVCRQFPQLPIRYLFRDPQLPLTQHFSALFSATWSSEFSAILHDDDWWLPDHLDHAVAALRDHPQSSAYGSARYWVRGESSLLFCDSAIFAWFGANYPPLAAVWELSPEQILLASLVDFPAHYSTLVMRSEALRKSANIYDFCNHYDSDRRLFFELSRQGTILYSPIVHGFVRLHALQDTCNFSTPAVEAAHVSTTEWIVDRAGQDWERVAEFFCQRVRQCPPEARAALDAEIVKPWCLPVLAQHVGEDSEVNRLYHQLSPRKSFLKRAGKQLLPPLLVSSGGRLLNSFLRRKNP